LGLSFGVETFESGASVHHMLKALDLLSAMVLYTVETALTEEGVATGDMADGVRLCRRFQQASSLLTLASAKGYTQAVSDGLRDRYRHLRHDLRNPLGTIKSVLALMDDESMPVDARSHPRFRAMATRNARSLEEMIAARLSDAAALLPALSFQSVSLRTIACTVRRDLRAEWERRDVSISIASAPPRIRIDAVALELLLRAVLLAAVQEAEEGDKLIVDFTGPVSDRATLRLTRDPSRSPMLTPTVREQLMVLAKQVGGRLEILGDRIAISVPTRRNDTGDDSRVAPDLTVESAGIDGPPADL
jgi:signal transduction histidine kinase